MICDTDSSITHEFIRNLLSSGKWCRVLDIERLCRAHIPPHIAVKRFETVNHRAGCKTKLADKVIKGREYVTLHKMQMLRQSGHVEYSEPVGARKSVIYLKIRLTKMGKEIVRKSINFERS